MPRLNLTHIILHHTAAEEKDAEQIRRYHLSKGWQDIGYDFMIERDGHTAAGRSLSIQGAHAGVLYYNQHAIGVAVIGNLSKRDIFPQQLASLIELLHELRKNYNIPLQNILLHKEIKNTECPGAQFPKKQIIKILEEKQETDIAPVNPELAKEIASLLHSLQLEKDKNRILNEKITQMKNALVQIRGIIDSI